MAGISKFRTDLSTAINLRIEASGGFIDTSRVDQLISDIEVVVNNHKATVLAEVAADLYFTSSLPRPFSCEDEIRASIMAALKEKGHIVNAPDVQNAVSAITGILHREVAAAKPVSATPSTPSTPTSHNPAEA